SVHRRPCGAGRAGVAARARGQNAVCALGGRQSAPARALEPPPLRPAFVGQRDLRRPGPGLCGCEAPEPGPAPRSDGAELVLRARRSGAAAAVVALLARLATRSGPGV